MESDSILSRIIRNGKEIVVLNDGTDPFHGFVEITKSNGLINIVFRGTSDLEVLREANSFGFTNVWATIDPDNLSDFIDALKYFMDETQ